VATLSEKPLPVLVGPAQCWLSNTFRPDPRLPAPLQYRFDVAGPSPVRQDLLVSQNGCRIAPVSDARADVTFRLIIYGRLPLD
jgi:hypothetical protein